jgi:hypothetical protein
VLDVPWPAPRRALRPGLDAVDLAAGTIEVRATAVRVRGRGLVVRTTWTDAGTRTLVLPGGCVAMLRSRAGRMNVTGAIRDDQPVSPAPLGGWHDLSNT